MATAQPWRLGYASDVPVQVHSFQMTDPIVKIDDAGEIRLDLTASKSAPAIIDLLFTS